MIRKTLIIVVMGCLLFMKQAYSQNITQTDSVKKGGVRDKITLSIGWKALYITNYFRGSNFVRRIEMSYRINERWKIGGSAFWGWRFGKNFGVDESINHINSRREALSLSWEEEKKDYSPYSFKEWKEENFTNFGLGPNRPGYALNFVYNGFEFFGEYVIGKINRKKQIKRKIETILHLGTTYIKGIAAGELEYVYSNINEQYYYYFTYRRVKYEDIGGIFMFRFTLEPKEKDIILPPMISLYYVYSPTQVKAGIKNFGWIWDVKILLSNIKRRKK
jgi:hypothetical protein